FHQVITNSITNSAYYSEEQLAVSVKMLNNLSEELNVMRLTLLETALETVAYNLNRKNENLLLFEFGKTYLTESTGKYIETEHLLLMCTGNLYSSDWRQKPAPADFYFIKGVSKKILQMTGARIDHFETAESAHGAVLKGFINR